jgi:hypothetical protein
MSFVHWFTSRLLPLCILGGATVYLFATNNQLPGSEKYLIFGFLAIMLLTILAGNLATHPAYAPGMLCLFIGILTFNSWQANGPHARSTIILAVLFAVLLLINFSKLSRSPEV